MATGAGVEGETESCLLGMWFQFYKNEKNYRKLLYNDLQLARVLFYLKMTKMISLMCCGFFLNHIVFLKKI